MTVGELLTRMSSEEISEWKMYHQILSQEAELYASGVGTH